MTTRSDEPWPAPANLPEVSNQQTPAQHGVPSDPAGPTSAFSPTSGGAAPRAAGAEPLPLNGRAFAHLCSALELLEAGWVGAALSELRAGREAGSVELRTREHSVDQTPKWVEDVLAELHKWASAPSLARTVLQSKPVVRGMYPWELASLKGEAASQVLRALARVCEELKRGCR